MISTPDTQIQILMTPSLGVSRIKADQGGFELPEQFVLQTTWVRKTTTPHPMGDWSLHRRALSSTMYRSGKKSFLVVTRIIIIISFEMK